MSTNDYIVLTIMLTLASVGLIRELRKSSYREKLPSISDFLVTDIDSASYALTMYSMDVKPREFAWTFNSITRVTGIEALTESSKTFGNAFITSIKKGVDEVLIKPLPLAMVVVDPHELPIPPLNPGMRFSVTVVFQGKLTIRPTGTHLISPKRKRRR